MVPSLEPRQVNVKMFEMDPIPTSNLKSSIRFLGTWQLDTMIYFRLEHRQAKYTVNDLAG